MKAGLSGMLRKAKEKVGGMRKDSNISDGGDLRPTSRLDTMFFASPDDRMIAMDKTQVPPPFLPANKSPTCNQLNGHSISMRYVFIVC